MKNKLSFLLSVVCLWGVILVSGCSEKDEAPTNLTLKEGTQTTQVVYADEVTNQGGISFTALSDWTATVTEVATEAATKAASGKVEWLELSAYSGGPGEYTLTLTLIENLTGKDRKATIEIRCGNDVITITVEQKATTEAGETPAPKEKRLVRYEITNSSSLYPDSYTKSIGELTYNENGKLAALKTISYQGDAQGYFTERIYQFTYQENQMWIDRKTLSGYESDESYVITLNSEGYVSQLYKKKESSSEQHTLWMFIYSEDFYKPKIVWGNLNLTASYAMIQDNSFINAPSPMIVPASKFLLAVLNSQLADYYIRHLGVTRNGGYFEYKPMFVEKLPVPQSVDAKVVTDIESYVDSKNETEIDKAVYMFYGLTEEEILYINQKDR